MDEPIVIDRPPPLNALSVIDNAIGKGITGEQLTLFVDAIERIERMKSEKAFGAAFAACQREIPAVLKTKNNSQTSSLYAELEEIQRLIVPVYTMHGFALDFGTAEAKREGDIRIVGTLTHEDGHSRQWHFDLPPDDAGIKGTVNKTPIHARASTLTYGQRYVTVLIFNIRLTTRVDVDGSQEEELILEADVAKIKTLLEQTHTSESLFFVWVSEAAKREIKTVEAMPRRIVRDAYGLLKGKLKKGAAS